MRASIRGMFATAGHDVQRQPLRTIISVAGLIAAIVAVIVVNAASELSLTANTEYIAWRYGRPATVAISAQLRPPESNQQGEGGEEPGPRGEAPAWATETGPAAETSIGALRMLEANGVADASLNVATQVWYRNGNTLVNARAAVVSPAYPRIKMIEMQYGMFPDATAIAGATHVVVTEHFVRSLGWEPDAAVGKALEFTSTPPDGETEYPLKQTPLQTMIIDGVAHWSGDEGGSQILLVTNEARPDLQQSTSLNLLGHVDERDAGYVSDLVSAWGRRQPVPLTEVSVQRADRLGELAPVLNQQNVTAGAVSAVALMIGGLGILGVGLSSVRERASEFGLRRALGASTLRIFFGSIVQTLLEVLIAVAIAIPLAAVIIQVFARRLVLESLPLPSDTSMPVGSAMLGLGAALAVGLLAGLLPAIRAARLSVVQALRE